MQKYCFIISIFLLSVLQLWAQVEININSTIKSHKISPMIQGFGLIYSFEADSIYADGNMAQLFKDVGAGYLRYPGGAVTTMYHWNDLNGHGWMDHWNETYNRSNDQAPENYMDLDEYMTLCKEAELEPMLGINMSSGRNYKRQEDGLNEAVALLKYCNEKNYKVKYLYLDNENHHKKWSPEEYGNQIIYYVDSIKKYAPDAKLIGNWTDKFRTNKGSFRTLLNIAGEHLDYMDVHFYWKWTNGSWTEWKAKTPMENETEWYTQGGTYVEEVEYFNKMMAELGYPHIKLASMEWNLGPGKYKDDANHNHFRTALMQSEMQMQFMQSGLEIASLWSTQWPNDSESDFRFLVSSSNSFKPTPTAKIFELYKYALNGSIVKSNSTHSQIMSTSVLKGDKLYIYLLNKADEEQDLLINLAGSEIETLNQALTFVDPGDLITTSVEMKDGKYKVTSLENTMTMIELRLKNTVTSLSDIQYKKGVEVYPNPASERITVKTKLLPEVKSLQILDITGSSVLIKTLDPLSKYHTFSVAGLSRGTYFLNISYQSGISVNSKLLIN